MGLLARAGMAVTSEPPGHPPEPPLDPHGSACTLTSSGCAWTLPGVRSPQECQAAPAPHPQVLPWAQTPWILHSIKGQARAFALHHNHPSAGPTTLLMCHHPPVLL